MDHIITLSVTLNLCLDEVFRLFSGKEGLEKWLAPKAEVQHEVGGKFELYWDLDDLENDSTKGCHLTGFEPDRFLSFEWRSPRQFKSFANRADPLTHVVIFFFPFDEEKTEVRLVHSGWRRTPEWEEARIWQERAWEMAFAQLEMTNQKTLD